MFALYLLFSPIADRKYNQSYVSRAYWCCCCRCCFQYCRPFPSKHNSLFVCCSYICQHRTLKNSPSRGERKKKRKSSRRTPLKLTHFLINATQCNQAVFRFADCNKKKLSFTNHLCFYICSCVYDSSCQ